MNRTISWLAAAVLLGSLSAQDAPPAKPDVADDWALRGWPTIVVIDAEWKIRYRGRDGDAATKVARELVAAMRAK